MADAPKANASSPGDIVVDNLGSHKGRAVHAAIRAAKAKLLFLPRLLARPQSDRTGLRQNEDPAAQGRRPNHRTDLANHRGAARLLHPDRMRKLTPPTQDGLQPEQIAL